MCAGRQGWLPSPGIYLASCSFTPPLALVSASFLWGGMFDLFLFLCIGLHTPLTSVCGLSGPYCLSWLYPGRLVATPHTPSCCCWVAMVYPSACSRNQNGTQLICMCYQAPLRAEQLLQCPSQLSLYLSQQESESLRRCLCCLICKCALKLERVHGDGIHPARHRWETQLNKSTPLRTVLLALESHGHRSQGLDHQEC
jgi:hypothetical protein